MNSIFVGQWGCASHLGLIERLFAHSMEQTQQVFPRQAWTCASKAAPGVNVLPDVTPEVCQAPQWWSPLLAGFAPSSKKGAVHTRTCSPPAKHAQVKVLPFARAINVNGSREQPAVAPTTFTWRVPQPPVERQEGSQQMTRFPTASLRLPMVSACAHNSRCACHACGVLQVPVTCCLYHSRSTSAPSPTLSSPCTRNHNRRVFCVGRRTVITLLVRSCSLQSRLAQRTTRLCPASRVPYQHLLSRKHCDGSRPSSFGDPVSVGCARGTSRICSTTPGVDMARLQKSLTTSKSGVALVVAATSSWGIVEVLRVS